MTNDTLLVEYMTRLESEHRRPAPRPRVRALIRRAKPQPR